jgi:hypothetical protein
MVIWTIWARSHPICGLTVSGSDMVIDLGVVKLFSDPASIAHVRDYHLTIWTMRRAASFWSKRAVVAGTL